MASATPVEMVILGLFFFFRCQVGNRPNKVKSILLITTCLPQELSLGQRAPTTQHLGGRLGRGGN